MAEFTDEEKEFLDSLMAEEEEDEVEDENEEDDE